MKNVQTIKSAEAKSPKTPGGISKSLLTPCRRVGLSRNWKKGGPSPFVSPLSGSTPNRIEDNIEKKPSRKRKEREEIVENYEETPCTLETPKPDDDDAVNDESKHSEQSTSKNDDISSTPTRHVEIPRKKKSKTLLSSLNVKEKVPPSDKNNEFGNDDQTEGNETPKSLITIQKSRSKGKIASKNSKENLKTESHTDIEMTNTSNTKTEQVQNVVTPLQKSKRKDKNILSQKNNTEMIINPTSDSNDVIKAKEVDINVSDKPNIAIENLEKEPKHRSPNELTKECIVVIQKKIFKSDKKKQKDKVAKSHDMSDSDPDVPLGQLNKSPTEKQEINLQIHDTKVENKAQDIINLVNDEEDFVEAKKVKVKKLEDKSTSIGGLTKKPKNRPKPQTAKTSQQTQSTDFDDEDDFDFDNKKTILIRKTYEKSVRQPQRAKSTGSITQKDIDELKARIEAKKKLILARAMTEDTEELRNLIKKWQKGCQDALMELMDLMKAKFPDKQNMDYSDMLSMLKIPANLVGYDEDNDCFCTPDDASIILSKFNNS